MIVSFIYEEILYQLEFGWLQGNRGDGWCLWIRDSNNEWFQIYFGDLFIVCGVDIQGYIGNYLWVIVFKLFFLIDGSSWIIYVYDNGMDMVSYFYNYFLVVSVFFFSFIFV